MERAIERRSRSSRSSRRVDTAQREFDSRLIKIRHYYQSFSSKFYVVKGSLKDGFSLGKQRKSKNLIEPF